MKHFAKVCIEVPFHDIDILGIAWHGHYYKYFEIARTELYRLCGFDILDMQEMGYTLPVIESQCKYVLPLKYGQKTQVSAKFSLYSNYIKIVYTVTDMESGKRHAYGYTKQAVCHLDGAMLMAVPDDVLKVIADANS
ncbi:MAG: acyl-CoA thioesterase [Mariprofundaceae bacterium]|nr:acyl-CoA thioesterase [Mariprofundaceae bacterium]